MRRLLAAALAALALSASTALAVTPPPAGRIGTTAFTTTYSNGRYHYRFNAKAFPCTAGDRFGCAVRAINVAIEIRLGQKFMDIQPRTGCKQSRRTWVTCTWGASTDDVAGGTAIVVTQAGKTVVTILTLTCSTVQHSTDPSDPSSKPNLCQGQ